MTDHFKPEIEKNVPLAKGYTAQNRPTSILSKMNIGDSVLFPLSLRNGTVSLSNYYKKIYNWKFASRKVDKDNFRIWRIK